MRPRLRPRRSRSSSQSPKTRSDVGLSRASPGRAATRRVSIFTSLELSAKRLELLRDLVPGAYGCAVLLDPANLSCGATLRDAEPAARAMGLQIQVLELADTRGEINAAFATLARDRIDALFVGPGPGS